MPAELCESHSCEQKSLTSESAGGMITATSSREARRHLQGVRADRQSARLSRVEFCSFEHKSKRNPRELHLCEMRGFRAARIAARHDFRVKANALSGAPFICASSQRVKGVSNVPFYQWRYRHHVHRPLC
jgi:hypothetical protein